MSFLILLLIAIGLSMDCFAVAIGTGFGNKHLKVVSFLKLSAFFGIAHFIMPLLGWLIGMAFKSYIETYDHWVAFALLLVIGIKMLIESGKKSEDRSFSIEKPVVILLLTIATSIDALIVGLSLALLGFNLLFIVSVISLCAFAISFTGFLIGKKVGCFCGNKAEIVGGIILILIGIKILFEHMA